MKKLTAIKPLAVATSKIRELSNDALSDVVGGHPLTGIPANPIAPQGNRTRVGR